MITREQVADLRPGDVVELTDEQWPDGTIVRGPLWWDEDWDLLRCGTASVRDEDGDVPRRAKDRTLTVVSRAPRPLYVNHDRTEPVPGDVVCKDQGVQWPIWVVGEGGKFAQLRRNNSVTWRELFELPRDNLRLLVDGETGQAVQS